MWQCWPEWTVSQLGWYLHVYWLPCRTACYATFNIAANHNAQRIFVNLLLHANQSVNQSERSRLTVEVWTGCDCRTEHCEVGYAPHCPVPSSLSAIAHSGRIQTATCPLPSKPGPCIWLTSWCPAWFCDMWQTTWRYIHRHVTVMCTHVTLHEIFATVSANTIRPKVKGQGWGILTWCSWYPQWRTRSRTVSVLDWCSQAARRRRPNLRSRYEGVCYTVNRR